jgi:hypothetical protein
MKIRGPFLFLRYMNYSLSMQFAKKIVISTGTQCSGEIYLEIDFSPEYSGLHFSRNDE